jgi:hypothetical protein
MTAEERAKAWVERRDFFVKTPEYEDLIETIREAERAVLLRAAEQIVARGAVNYCDCPARLRSLAALPSGERKGGR